jgi:hypothetical protein
VHSHHNFALCEIPGSGLTCRSVVTWVTWVYPRGYPASRMSHSGGSQGGVSKYVHQSRITRGGFEPLTLALRTFSGVQVMGYEGILGTLMMLFIGLPIAWLLPGIDPGKYFPSLVRAAAHV